MAANPENRNVPARVDRLDRVHMGWTVARISALVLALVLFNRYREHLGVIVSAGDRASFVPLLPPEAFDALLLRLNVWWGMTLALCVVNLWVGHWMWGTRLVECALAFFGMFILAKAISSPLLDITPQWVQLGQPALSYAMGFLPVLTWMLRGCLAVALIVWLILLAVKLRTLQRVASLSPA